MKKYQETKRAASCTVVLFASCAYLGGHANINTLRLITIHYDQRLCCFARRRAVNSISCHVYTADNTPAPCCVELVATVWRQHDLRVCMTAAVYNRSVCDENYGELGNSEWRSEVS